MVLVAKEHLADFVIHFKQIRVLFLIEQLSDNENRSMDLGAEKGENEPDLRQRIDEHTCSWSQKSFSWLV